MSRGKQKISDDEQIVYNFLNKVTLHCYEDLSYGPCAKEICKLTTYQRISVFSRAFLGEQAI